jgi:hypothetical protein
MQSQLAQLESLAIAAYTSPDANQRQQAQMMLQGFTNSPECIPQCRLIITESTNQYALLMASSSLLKLVTTFWNGFTPSQSLDMRTFLVNFLGGKCNDLQPMIIRAIIQVIVRVTKLGWSHSNEQREIINIVQSFMTVSLVLSSSCFFQQFILCINGEGNAKGVNRIFLEASFSLHALSNNFMKILLFFTLAFSNPLQHRPSNSQRACA